MPRAALVRAASPLAALAVLVGGLAPAAGDGVPRPVHGSRGIGDGYFPEDGNGGIDVQSYAIHDAYRFRDGRLSGHTVVRITPLATLSSFDLDFLLPVSSVRLSNGPASYSRPDRHELRIHPARPLVAGRTFTATVTYAGHPDRVGWRGERDWLADDHEVVAMNQPHMAAWWFPANDHPRDKATVDLHVRVPHGNRVIGNGHLLGVRRGATHATYHWGGGGPMTTYLAFFAAGRFDVAHGVSHGLPWYAAVSAQVPQPERRAAMRRLKASPGIVRWLSHRLGPYPFGDTGGLVTSLGPGFALENQTRPTYPVLGPSGKILEVHELAHQWFGDSVSLHGWRGIWLNEGAATFMEKLWTEKHGGEPASAWLENTYHQTPSDDPLWHLVVANPGPAHLFDYPVYDRGGLALQALRQRLGDHVFGQVLRTWLRERRGSTGTTGQFRRVAERVSGAHLRGFFHSWLRSPTKPAETAANGL
ncbi:MAG: M1 family metallopeptidase [Nocardioides sp.]